MCIRGVPMLEKIIMWILERKVRKARKNFYKQLKLLREDKVDFSKVLVPGITGELKGESLVVYKGATDADGNVGGTTLKCSAIGSASAYPDFNGNQIIFTSGSYKGHARSIDGVTNGDAAGTIKLKSYAFDGRILSGTSFIIVVVQGRPPKAPPDLTGSRGVRSK